MIAQQQSPPGTAGPARRRRGPRSASRRAAPEQERSGDVEDFLLLLAERGLAAEVLEDRLLLGQAGVDVLGVDADLAAVAPADLAGERLERIDDRPQERRLALAVVADDRRPRAVVDLQLDVRGDLPFRVADRQVAAAQGDALARLDPRRADAGGRLVAGDLVQFQLLELLALRLGQLGGGGPGLVAGDEVFEVPPLGQDRLVGPLVVLAAFALELQVRVDLAGERRQLAARQVERVVAGGAEERPVVRDDQAAAVVSRAGSVRAESASAGRGSSSARRAAAGSARAAAGPPASRASASRRRAWRSGLRGTPPSARTARPPRRTSSRAGRCRASGSRGRIRRAGTGRAGGGSRGAGSDGE